MNRSVCAVVIATQVSALVCGLAFTCRAQTTPAAEPSFVVKITDIKRQSEYQAMSQGELNDLRKQNALEQRFFDQAMSQATQDWKADKQNDRTPFPSSRFAAPQLEVTEQFTSRDQADKKVAAYQEREMKKEKEKAKQEKTATPDKAKLAKEDAADRAFQLLQAKMTDLISKEREKTAPKDTSSSSTSAPAGKTE